MLSFASEKVNSGSCVVRPLSIASLLLVAVAMALAHALELPGKMRLDRETYLAVQIYYPGFTFGGAAEPLAILALLALLIFATPAGCRLWWAAGALGALVAMQAIYWLVTHPVNSVWTQGLELSGLGASFFATFGGDMSGDWQRLRDVWEYSHVARAVCGMTALFCVAMATMV